MSKKPLLDFDEARKQLLEAARPVADVEQVTLLEAAGRVLARAIVSGISVPPLDNSAMDGYAVRVADVSAPGTRLTVAQRIPAGTVGNLLQPGTAARIFTGAPIPAGADAVVMQEQCVQDGSSVIVNFVPRVGDHVRCAGDDIATGTEVLSAGSFLTPQSIGLAASVGTATVPVFRRLSVAVLSTGDELAMPGEALPPGGIFNSNKPMLLALLARMGVRADDMGNVPDTFEATRAALRRAGQSYDLVLTTGGVSVGEEDHVKPSVEAEGELSLWNIAVKPGKPLAFGQVGRAAFLGLPGNPVAALVTFVLLVRPFVRACQGLVAQPPRSMLLPAVFDWPRPANRREFLRVRQTDAGQLELYPNQSSGVLTSTVWADGLVDNPANQAIRSGDLVRYIPMTELT
jgi:molybdopterin molybdotransferase